MSAPSRRFRAAWFRRPSVFYVSELVLVVLESHTIDSLFGTANKSRPSRLAFAESKSAMLPTCWEFVESISAEAGRGVSRTGLLNPCCSIVEELGGPDDGA